MLVLDAQTRHRLAPHFSGTLRDREFDTRVRTNGLGMRDKEIGPPIHGRRRFLVMGDSFTFGEGVEESDAFPKRLESLLNEGHATPIVEVLNGGTPGYATIHEIRWLRRLLPRLHPDVVIIAFYVGNDLEYNDLSTNFSQLGLRLVEGKIAEPANKPHSNFHRLKMLLANYSSLYRLVVHRAHTSPTVSRLAYKTGLSEGLFEIPFDIQQFTKGSSENVEARWRDTDRILREFQELCTCEGCIPYIAIVPARLQYDQNLWTRALAQYGLDENLYDARVVNRRLVDIARKHSIETVDLLPSFAQEKQVERFHYSRDGHWNAQGHALVAKSLAHYFTGKLKFSPQSPKASTLVTSCT
ncbi:MAG: SGNH/GDSL hydrolase family protein [Candidatus Methylomirabilales bacterium]